VLNNCSAKSEICREVSLRLSFEFTYRVRYSYAEGLARVGWGEDHVEVLHVGHCPTREADCAAGLLVPLRGDCPGASIGSPADGSG